MRKLFLILLLFPVISFASQKNGDNGAIIYGPHQAFTIVAPMGWVLDTQSGLKDDVVAAVYPKGGSWKNSPTVMYARGVVKKENETFEQFIVRDLKDFQGRYPTVESQDITSSVNNKTKIKKFSYGSTKEIIAYIEEEKSITLLVLSTRSQTELDKAYPAFKEFMKSYHFISSEVDIK